MKNKTEEIDKIIGERFFMFNKLFWHTRWLILSKKPLNQRLAIWQKDFDSLVLKFAKQDRLVRKLVEN